MEKINIALIGAGGMANGVHYPSLVEFEDVNLVALCDLVESKLQATAAQFEIENPFIDYKQMIEATSPSAVSVLLATSVLITHLHFHKKKTTSSIF